MRQGRRGFTLIELLVVIAIIGILGCHRYRLSTWWWRPPGGCACQSNLKQIGTAMKAYHGQYDCYPSGLCCCPPANNILVAESIGGIGYRLNGFSSMLPFFEQQALQNLYNTEDMWWNASSTVAATRIDVFICPSSEDTNINEPNLATAFSGADVYGVCPLSLRVEQGGFGRLVHPVPSRGHRQDSSAIRRHDTPAECFYSRGRTRSFRPQQPGS